MDRFFHELRDEVLLWEGRTGAWLLGAADRTRLQWLRLGQCMGADNAQLLAGEEARNQRVRCVDCGDGFNVHGALRLKPCSSCGCEYYITEPLHH